MTRYFRRRRPSFRETLVAAALAAGAAAVTFYLTRVLVARETLDGRAGPEPRRGGEDPSGES